MQTRRFRLFVAVLCLAPLAFIGCNRDPGSGNPDLTPTGTGCLAIITCASGCAGNATCSQACVAAGSTQGVGLYQALFACAYGRCIVGPDAGTASDLGAPDDAGTPSDGGTGTCTSTTDTSPGCMSCVSTQAQGSGCASQLSACLAN